jgi:putative membrane protein
MNFFFKTIILSIAVFISALVLPGVEIDNYLNAILIALFLSVLNNSVKPLLIILTLPFTIVTFGLFLLFINAIIIYIVDYFVDGFSVDGIWYAILFSILTSLVQSILESVNKKSKKEED